MESNDIRELFSKEIVEKANKEMNTHSLCCIGYISFGIADFQGYKKEEDK